MGDAKQCLRVRIERDYKNDIITLDQEMKMSDCNSVSTPFGCNFDLENAQNKKNKPI